MAGTGTAVSLSPVPMATVTSWGPGERAELGAGKLESFLPRNPPGQEQTFTLGGVTRAHVYRVPIATI